MVGVCVDGICRGMVCGSCPVPVASELPLRDPDMIPRSSCLCCCPYWPKEVVAKPSRSPAQSKRRIIDCSLPTGNTMLRRAPWPSLRNPALDCYSELAGIIGERGQAIEVLAKKARQHPLTAPPANGLLCSLYSPRLGEEVPV